VSRYLLDTNAAADAIFRRRGVPERVKATRAAGHDVGMGIPVLGELYAGAEFSASRNHNLDILRLLGRSQNANQTVARQSKAFSANKT
jgi:tRNA(fMet)-specific endonuclease VapC